MAFEKPAFTKADVNRAGELLVSGDVNRAEWAFEVLANWRACHGYPMNTFQALLRLRLKTIDDDAIVAQRLKRAPSVIAKLRRFKTMNLSQMQDIAGLRAVLSSVTRVRRLEEAYRESKFKHQLVSSKDYIEKPKPDGYRSVHLVYRYNNEIVKAYNGLLLELQFRTKLQHAWATAVETMSTFLGHALKSGEGERPWRQFFEIASAAFTFLERTPPVPGYEQYSAHDVFRQLADAERELRVLNKLHGFSIAADRITTERGSGSYHLVVLEADTRSVSIRPFAMTQLQEANLAYARIEERATRGEPIEAVLVSAGPVEALKKAYPNYFLDTDQFVRQVGRVIAASRARPGQMIIPRAT